jgi:alkyl hydroperoxide reductase subunit AhpC
VLCAVLCVQAIAARYGVLLEKAGIALRGLFIINPEGIIQQITINDLVSRVRV